MARHAQEVPEDALGSLLRVLVWLLSFLYLCMFFCRFLFVFFVRFCLLSYGSCGTTNSRKEGIRKALISVALIAGRNKKSNRTGRTEPFNFGTGRNRTRNRTGPNHDAFKKRRPNRIELEKQLPNRTEPKFHSFSKIAEPKRIEPNRFLPVLIGGALNALKFQCAQRDSLSELFLYVKRKCLLAGARESL